MTENKKIESDIKEKLVAINRITKVVKGGRRFGFAALVVVGNKKDLLVLGKVNLSKYLMQLRKQLNVAKRNLIKIPLKEGRTLHHDVNGKNGSGKVFLTAAPAGTGIIAGGAIRSVCEVLEFKMLLQNHWAQLTPQCFESMCKWSKISKFPKTLSVIRGKK